MTGSAHFLAEARSDAQDRLIEAGEPLAGLQQRCGGNLPGTIAIPELLALVRKARLYGFKLARMVHAVDGPDLVRAWVEILPERAFGPDEGGGCVIKFANWQTVPMPIDDQTVSTVRQRDLDSALAELTARIDQRQQILTVESKALDLVDVVNKMRAAIGQPWTDFVEFSGNAHQQPLHWRLLDGARCSIAGSDRVWRVSLVPLGQPDVGSAGFDLSLIAETPYASPGPSASVKGEAGLGRSIGRDLSPVLRQPIARIIANAETIRSRLAGPLADEYSNYAADIASAGEHLLALIDDLSDLEVVEADDFTTAPDRINLADVARRAAGILGVRARERGIALIAPDPGETLEATAEFRRVLQILLNLVGNAIRYSPAGSEVRIELGMNGSCAQVSVADNGQGLTADQQAAVFNKFERLGRSGDGGSGLGLYISRRIARAMGGDLTVKSEPGEGARFAIELPGAV